MNNVCIGNRKIGQQEPVYVIAEISANHLQDFNRAKSIIKAAADSGADAVKLQTYKPDTITLNCKTDDFLATHGSPWEGKNIYEIYKTAYTPWEWHGELIAYANALGISCFSSPFDESAVDFLERLNVPAYKIASLEILDIPLIEKVASTGKPIVISTGIAKIEDIELAIETCKKENNNNIILLKCVTEYPTPYDEINLLTLNNMQETFDCVVGLSDHSMGSCVPIAAVTLGARVVEKHLTLKRTDGGPDASFSMEPEEFKRMVSDIRNVQTALGKVTYSLTEKQTISRKKGRSLYVCREIKKGDRFSLENIKSVRPGFGLHPKYLYSIIGKKAKKDLKYGDALRWEYIEE